MEDSNTAGNVNQVLVQDALRPKLAAAFWAAKTRMFCLDTLMRQNLRVGMWQLERTEFTASRDTKESEQK